MRVQINHRLPDIISVTIVFHAGAYGTYLHWLVHTLLDSKIQDPLIGSGASHGFNNNLIKSQVQSGSDTVEIQHIHLYPSSDTGDMVQTLQTFLDDGNRVIFLYPGRQDYLWIINNWIYKSPHVTGDKDPSPGVFYQRLVEQNQHNLSRGWKIQPEEIMQPSNRWILREFLSLNLFPAWEDQMGWYLPDRISHPNCLYIRTSDLLSSVDTALDAVKSFYHLKWQQTYDSIRNIHQKNLSLQKFMAQDRLVGEILTALDQGLDLCWDPEDLTLVSEAYLQKSLRESGRELRCHRLNHLPTNTNALGSLLS